jgi:hypothetical protein
MLNDEPLTPSEAVIDRFPDLTNDAFAAWMLLQRQLMLCGFRRVMRFCHGCFDDGKPHARPRPRNTRIQRVQATRKQLNLNQDGKYPTLRSRKASYAFAYEVERWCEMKRETPPRPRDFEHVPARRRKREARRQLKWKPIQASEQDLAWMDWMDMLHANTCEICAAFGISEKLLTGELSTMNVDNSLNKAIPFYATQESEQHNG